MIYCSALCFIDWSVWEQSGRVDRGDKQFCSSLFIVCCDVWCGMVWAEEENSKLWSNCGRPSRKQANAHPQKGSTSLRVNRICRRILSFVCGKLCEFGEEMKRKTLRVNVIRRFMYSEVRCYFVCFFSVPSRSFLRRNSVRCQIDVFFFSSLGLFCSPILDWLVGAGVVIQFTVGIL